MRDLSDDYDLVVAQNLGLGQLFYKQVLQNPDAVAVVDGPLSLTYQELHAKCLQIANELQKDHSLTREECVGIIVQHGILDVVAQMAVIYAGGSCISIDPALPVNQVQDRLARLNVRYLLVGPEQSGHTTLQSVFHHIAIDALAVPSPRSEASSPRLGPAETKTGDQFPVLTDLEHRSHVIYTSGTTSEPKAVQIASRSILEVVYHAPFEPLHAADIVAHANNSTFDVALFDVWAPLLRGARIAVVPKAVLLDLPILAEHIDKMGITVMATTTALLNLAAATYPQAFSRLRMCWIGGEAANMKAVKEIFTHGPPEILINAYGPTECCVLCLAHQITYEDVIAGTVGIGKPIGRTTAHVCEPATGEAVADGEVGELWIGGPGVSPGYVNQAEKNAKVFVNVNSVDTQGSSTTTRMYRTGDLVRRRSGDGQIEFIGRADNQVKIRGYRIELEAVEVALMKTEQFSEVAALKVEVSQDETSSLLVAYAVALSPEHTSVQQATAVVRTLLPEYMVPRIELIDRMPLNGNAKVDRKQLAALYRQRWTTQTAVTDGKTSESGADQSLTVAEDAKTTRSLLEGLWANILGLPDRGSFADSDDFFQLGGTSLQVSLLVSQIRATFQRSVPLLTLYDHSTLGALTAIVDGASSQALGTVRNERDVWVADTYIADHLVCPLPAQPVDWRRDTEGRVFLTGATGFVGAFILADLLKMTGVHQVGCLVRAANPDVGLQRLKAGMEKYGLWQEDFQAKLLALPGQLEEPDLAMGTERFEEIASWASVIFHLGARVNYTQPYSLHRPANTLGTLHIMNLAITGRLKTVHYVSSISCFGPTGKFCGTRRVLEDECLLKHIDALPYDHGYAQSQWVVEQLLRRLIERGFPIAVYRPGFITGHSQTGMCNPDDFFSRLIVACEKMGCYPRLPNQRKEFVPVDYVNAVILHIATLSSSSSAPAKISPLLGHAYQIVPPSPEVSVDMDDTMKLVGQYSPTGRIADVSYTDWLEKLAAAPPLPLQPLQPMLAEIVHKGLTRWELYENMPVYDQTNTQQALAASPVEFPELDGTLMQKYIQHLRAKV